MTNLPITERQTTQEIFTSYNVGTTTGGGVGGYEPQRTTCTAAISNEIDAYVARFNPNGLAAAATADQGTSAMRPPQPGLRTNHHRDRSPLHPHAAIQLRRIPV